MQQNEAGIVQHLERELAFITVPARPVVGRADRLVKRFLKRLAFLRRHVAPHHPGDEARALGKLGVEQLLDLVSRVAVALEGDERHRHGEQAEHEHQRARTDRAHQALSTR